MDTGSPMPFGSRDASNSVDPPGLTHKFQDERSILALAISEGRIFAGTQAGELLVLR